MYLSRSEDRIALGGTTGTVIAFIIVAMLMLRFCTVKGIQDELDAGGVTVSLGQPDLGGEDASTAQQEEFVEPEEEEYTPESQVTSDVEEAPEVQRTKPTTTPKPKTTPTETKPKETTTKPRTADPRSTFGTKKSGSGSGGGTTGGDKGDPNGSPDGSPDGQGKGDSGEGIDMGSGISGGIGGFKVAKVVQPQGGVQENGVVRLKVCVDRNGSVIPSSIKYSPDRDPLTTSNSELIRRATDALRKFQFTNTSNSSGGCGYMKFTFKLQ